MIKGTENIVIGDLISRRVPFFVPKYQRNYAWELDEVDDFIADVSHLYENRIGGQQSSLRHFFGGIVSIDILVPGSMHGRSFELVDGQQRLATFIATISLVIRAFRSIADQATTSGDKATADAASAQAQLTQQNYLMYQEVVNNQIQQKLRVSLSNADSTFFTQLLDGKTVHATRDSHRKLAAAYGRIQEKLLDQVVLSGALTPAQRLSNLLVLQQCLFENCHIIHVYSDDRKEAYRLFRILNDRGRAISDGDKLRSHTLEALEGEPQLQAVAEQQWDDILSLGQSEVDSFLQAFYTAQTGEKAPRRELFDQFVAKLLTPPRSAQHRSYIATRVTQLLTAKGHYLSLVTGEWPYAPTVVSAWKRDRLARLMQVLRHNLCLPLLLAIRETNSEAVFTEVVLLVERFAFRYVNVVAAHHNPPNTVYANSTKAIRANPSTFSVVQLRQDLAGIVQRYAGDAVFESSLFNKLDYTQSNQRRLIKHFLTTVEDHRAWLINEGSGTPSADETRVLDVGTNTIEHIYPQNSQQAFIDQALEPRKQTLPNLTFWAASDNQAAGNLPFDQKRPFYSQSHVGMNRDLAQLPAFDLVAINTRRTELWNAAAKIFRI